MKLSVSKIFLLLVISCSHLAAQENGKGQKITISDFDLAKSAAVDNNANAVIISDVGSTNFIGDKRNWFSYVFKRSVRIKIVNKSAFDLATIRLRLYGINEPDELSSVSGATYNIEDGKVVEYKLDAKNIFEDKLVKGIVEKKFTLPAIKEGSIIEYNYTITSFRYYDLPTWSFQHLQYPCLNSRFEIAIPAALAYVLVRHGADSFYLNKSEQVYQRYSMQNVSVSSDANKHTWAMKDVPAFKTEAFIYSPSDYLDKIEFHLAQTYNGEDTRNVMVNWDGVTKDLLNDSQFGAAIPAEDNSNLSNIAVNASRNETVLLQSAKNIYNYVRDNIVCIDYSDIWTRHDLYDVNKNKKGNVAEINLLLVGLLRQKKITADPVVLSTRDYGVNPANYPVLNKMNYVICRTIINGKIYYLDATHPILDFGRLPLECFNGHARIINKANGASIFLQADSIREQETTLVNISSEKKGSLKINYQFMPGFFESDKIRKQVSKEGEEKFFNSVKASFVGDVEMTATKIDSLYQLEYPVRVSYQMVSNNNGDVIYFSPVIDPFFEQNPFKATERVFPIEMDYPINKAYVLNMQIPAGYEVDDFPKSVRVNYNGGEGSFQYMIQKDQTTIQLRTTIEMKAATFRAEDYNSLRDFFAFVIKKQSEQIVFKKQK